VAYPALLYGTAWKEDRTRGLVESALAAGFTGIDTANQRKHYHEAAVGEALAGRDRAQLFLQTKFTHRAGQDHRLPYDPAAPIATQVEQSFKSSLAHLGTDYLDSYVLHGPSTRFGLAPADWDAWRAMEKIHGAGGTRLLGVSNVSLQQLEALHEQAAVKPAFVQNRCYAHAGWDADVRAFCVAHGVVYQGFSLLTANARELAHPEIQALARAKGCTVPMLTFAFALAKGMLPLTGTSDPRHMRDDLGAPDVSLTPDEVQWLGSCTGGRA